METQPSSRGAKASAREKLLASALKLVRQKGYEATTVDELCRESGVTKGAFFHHFKSKEDLGVAAAKHWNEGTGRLFATADYHTHEDPLDRLIGYIDFRAQLLRGADLADRTCLLGTMVQETYQSHPTLREACEGGIMFHAAAVAELVEQAKARHAPHASWTAESVALHTQAVIQGAFILAKARGNMDVAADSILHLRRYIELLFHYGKDD